MKSTTTKKMYLTEAEAKAINLPSNEEQIAQIARVMALSMTADDTSEYIRLHNRESALRRSANVTALEDAAIADKAARLASAYERGI